jgi:hypothetical protein
MTDQPEQPPVGVWNPVLDVPSLLEVLKRRLTVAADERERDEIQALIEDAESWMAEQGRP